MLNNENPEWNEEVYRKHIESVCILMKEYYGNTYKIERLGNKEWQVSKFPSTRYVQKAYIFTELTDAIQFFVEQEPKAGWSDAS